jgi:Zn-dependent alcohol dehydrogenase
VAAAVVKADPIIAVDLDDEKLEFAKRFGATIGVNASGGDAIEQIHELTQSGGLTSFGEPVSGVDFAFDCIGREVTMNQILRAVRPGILGAETGGTAVLVGVPQSGVSFTEDDMRGMLINEKKYIGSIGGSCRPDRDFPMFLAWAEDGALDLDAMVTERFKIGQINEATAALEQGEIFGRAIMEFDD